MAAERMEREFPRWPRILASLARTAFWLLLIAIVLLQLSASGGADKARGDVLHRFEQERGSRVIALIHRQDTASLFGVPVASSISIEDSEALLRAIRLTPPEQPIDIILHTPGGLVLAAEQIARALLERKAKVTAFVPHYAMSGGTLIALAAHEIVMDSNAVLGPVDPQIGSLPAASIVRAADMKGTQAEDQLLIMADIARKARAQIGASVTQLSRSTWLPNRPATWLQRFQRGAGRTTTELLRKPRAASGSRYPSPCRAPYMS